MSRRCEACRSYRLRPLLGSSRERGPVSRCADCGLVTVDDPPPAGINDDPMGFDDAVRAALA